MTTDEKQMILKLRGEGLGYKAIARIMGISVNTISSFCRRNNTDELVVTTVAIAKPKVIKCLNCGVDVIQNPKRKIKKFCCDKCRMKWWNKHPEKMNRKSYHHYICKYCSKPFSHYGSTSGKYCSHECYIKDRFGGGGSNEN